MSFGLLATLRDELLSLISFNHLIRVILFPELMVARPIGDRLWDE